jgi:hypothetical protein
MWQKHSSASSSSDMRCLTHDLSFQTVHMLVLLLQQSQLPVGAWGSVALQEL